MEGGRRCVQGGGKGGVESMGKGGAGGTGMAGFDGGEKGRIDGLVVVGCNGEVIYQLHAVWCGLAEE